MQSVLIKSFSVLILSYFTLLAGCSGTSPLSDGGIPDSGGMDGSTDGGLDSGCDAGSVDAWYGPNLVPNPDLTELAQDAGMPASWTHPAWGGLDASFDWITDGGDAGFNYLRTEVSDYSSGDAKWVFDPVTMEPGNWYEFSDLQRSDVRARLVWSCKSPGDTVYHWAWQSEATESWNPTSFRFYLSPGLQCETSASHMLDSNGWLETGKYNFRKSGPLPLCRGMVSVTFDDIWETAYTIGAHELEKRGLRGSFYVATNYTINKIPGYASEIEIKTLITAGHEVGSHTSSEARLTTLDDSKLNAELQDSMAYLAGLGASVQGIAWPYGDYDARVITAAKKEYTYARTSLDGLNDRTADAWHVRIIPVVSTTTDEALLQAVEDASTTSTWVVFLFHKLGDPVGADPYLTSAIQYKKLMDRLIKGDVNNVTVYEGLVATGLMQ